MLACNQPLEEVPWLDELVVNGRVRPLTRKEESQVAEVLAVGKAAAAVPPALRATAAAKCVRVCPPPLPVETHEPATTGTVPTSRRRNRAFSLLQDETAAGRETDP